MIHRSISKSWLPQLLIASKNAKQTIANDQTQAKIDGEQPPQIALEAFQHDPAVRPLPSTQPPLETQENSAITQIHFDELPAIEYAIIQARRQGKRHALDAHLERQRKGGVSVWIAPGSDQRE
jgi:hypothetical protein